MGIAALNGLDRARCKASPALASADLLRNARPADAPAGYMTALIVCSRNSALGRTARRPDRRRRPGARERARAAPPSTPVAKSGLDPLLAALR